MTEANDADVLDREQGIEIERTASGICASIYKDAGHGCRELMETNSWTEDELADGSPIAVGESVELKYTDEGLSVSVYDHREDHSHILDEGYWWHSELDAMEADEMMFSCK